MCTVTPPGFSHECWRFTLISSHLYSKEFINWATSAPHSNVHFYGVVIQMLLVFILILEVTHRFYFPLWLHKWHMQHCYHLQNILELLSNTFPVVWDRCSYVVYLSEGTHSGDSAYPTFCFNVQEQQDGALGLSSSPISEKSHLKEPLPPSPQCPLHSAHKPLL